ncbi:MAG: sulfite exporter TauE/SafE family protein [Porticoccaceae bacterium]
MPLDPSQILLLWAGVIFASVLRAFTGFGFALAVVPVFAMFLAPAEVVVLAASLSLVLGMVSVRTWWGLFSVREILPLITLAWVGTVVGVYLLTGMSQGSFQLWVGIAVLLACLAVTLSKPANPVDSSALRGGAGLLSGLMNGALAVPGPPMIVYALLTEFDPARSRALLMLFFTASSLWALVSFAVADLFVPAIPWYITLALPALFVGDRLGNTLFVKYSDAFYRRVAVLVLLSMGILVILKAL